MLQCRGEEGGGGGVSLLPSPEGTAASGTSPESSDGARSPQTSENKHTLLVLISNSSNIIILLKHIRCISFHNITLMFAFLRLEGYFLMSFSLIRIHNTILCFSCWNVFCLGSLKMRFSPLDLLNKGFIHSGMKHL